MSSAASVSRQRAAARGRQVSLSSAAAEDQKNPRAHKNKISTPPPQNQIPPPKKNEEFYGHGGFPAERRHFFQVSIKLSQPFPALQNCGHEFYGHEDFSEMTPLELMPRACRARVREPYTRESGRPPKLGGRFGYFYFFFCSVEGEWGSPRRQEGGGESVF